MFYTWILIIALMLFAGRRVRRKTGTMRIQIRKTKGHYHRTMKITWGEHRFKLSWRWYPLIMWRYFPRAWQGFPPAGVTMATDWTGRDREVMGVVWRVEWLHWTVIENPDPATLEFVA